MAEKDADKGIERVYVVPFRQIKKGKSSRAAPRAVKHVRRFLTRHMKVKEDDIWIDESLNEQLWSKGKYKAPNRLRVRAVKFEDGVVEASLPELGYKKSRREFLKEEREKKTPILRREEAEVGEEGVAGAEEYDIAPTADGEVKIKKKKAPKEKKEEKEEKPKKKSAVKKKKKAEVAEPAEKTKEKPKKRIRVGKKASVKPPVADKKKATKKPAPPKKKAPVAKKTTKKTSAAKKKTAPKKTTRKKT
jgi:large subunit ribosomal protein L31e